MREPILSFELKGGEQWGLYGMNLLAWHEILGIVAVEALMVVCLSALVYKVVVQKPFGHAVSCLVCYCLVIPSLFAGPFLGFLAFNVQNQFFRFCVGAILPVTCLFKSTASVHGFAPKYAMLSLKNFAFYYSVPLPMEYDVKLDKYAPTSAADILSHLKGFFTTMTIFGALNSMIFYFDGIMPPMATGRLPADWYSLSSFLSPHVWFPRNLLFAMYFQVIISVMGEGLVIAQTLLTRVKVKTVMDNPVMTSRSFSQFWGAKWNLVVHEVLKHGVYLPMRKHFPKQVAVLSTFVASGLFHEGLLYMCMYPLGETALKCASGGADIDAVDCYLPTPFVTTLFFVWQAVGMAMEQTLPICQWEGWARVPDPLMTAIIVTCGCPLAHYFCEPYWNSLVFENGMILFFVIKPVSA